MDVWELGFTALFHFLSVTGARKFKLGHRKKVCFGVESGQASCSQDLLQQETHVNQTDMSPNPFSFTSQPTGNAVYL